jgi:isoamylase
VLAIRRRQRRNLLATLLLSQGVPMLMAGDEFGRTQRGNNNAYCQDNEISWLDWGLRDVESATVRFVSFLTQIRRENPVFRRTSFLSGVAHPESQLKDVTWLKENGTEMTETDWRDPARRTLGVLLDRAGVDPQRREPGDREAGGSFLLLLNAGENAIDFTLPAPVASEHWEVVLDTGQESVSEPTDVYRTGHVYVVGPQSLTLLGEPR